MSYKHETFRFFNNNKSLINLYPFEKSLNIYLDSDEAKDIAFDVDVIKHNNDFSFTFTNFFYKFDDIRIYSILAKSSDGRYFLFSISGYFKDKVFTIECNSKELHNIINNEKFSTKLIYGMKKYISNTLSFRLVMHLVKEICINKSYQITKEK